MSPAYASNVYKTPRTRPRPALLPDSFISLHAAATGQEQQHTTPWTPLRRPSLKDISHCSNLEQSHFSDWSSSSPTKEASSDISLSPPSQVPSSRPAGMDLFGKPMPAQTGRSIFISSPKPVRPTLVNFLSMSSSPVEEGHHGSCSDSSPMTIDSLNSSPASHHHYSSPDSPILHIKLGTSPSGAAEPVIRPVLPSVYDLQRQPRHFDFQVNDMAAQLDTFFGSTPQQTKAERCSYNGLGIAFSADAWKRQSDFEPLISPGHRSPRSHARSHHPYARSAHRHSRKQRPPPLNLTGISALHRTKPQPAPAARVPRLTRPVLFRDQQPLQHAQVQHPVDAEIQTRLAPSLLPAVDTGLGSNLKRKMSLSNLLNFSSRSFAIRSKS